MVKLSVVIVNYNVEYFLQQCLYSVFKALHSIPAEVFVVDNNSVDGSLSMLKEYFPQVTLIENTENVGFSRANNQAINISKGEYVLLLNPDTLVQEDTFEKIIQFMDEHPEAGGLGVKMIDGKGRFLPESKRGLPTPAVAFYKIFGISALFPKSKIAGKYHLGFLDENEIHEVDILSGAFMLMRREALNKVGLLDEDFFMYGEDIDLSWRIVRAGYKNYYYPETKIIHYKGESTKKSSINYVVVFYNAMIIFARKHFSEKNAKTFSFLINLAIYFRAGIAIGFRFLKTIALPLTDFILLLGGLYLLGYYYESVTEINLTNEMVNIALPLYGLIWIGSAFLNGGYDKPFNALRFSTGLIAGSAVILILYSLLPESYRFSRAIILLGTAVAFLTTFAVRLLMWGLKIPGYSFSPYRSARLALVGSMEEISRVESLMRESNLIPGKVIHIAPAFSKPDNAFHGHLGQMNDIINVYQIDEIVFCARDVPSHTIIDMMARLDHSKVDFKIAPPESLYIIGSNSIVRGGEFFILEMNPISKPENRRSKRFFDLILSVLLILTLPLNFWFVKNKINYIKNLFRVLSGKKTWVGFALSPQKTEQYVLPELKPGVITPLDVFSPTNHTMETARKLNSVYARDYRRRNDLNIVFKAFSKLGR